MNTCIALINIYDSFEILKHSLQEFKRVKINVYGRLVHNAWMKYRENMYLRIYWNSKSFALFFILLNTEYW